MKTILRLVITITLCLPSPVVHASLPEDGRFPKDPKIPVNPSWVHYFQSTYGECRNTFLKLADSLKAIYPEAQIFSVKVSASQNESGSVDGIYIPPAGNPVNLLILSGGTHGVEGFTGSAIQHMFIEKYIRQNLRVNTGILLIHGLNPYGFMNNRRVTGNNVDLNRNCGISDALYKTSNDGYKDLFTFINPDGPASIGSLENRLFVFRAVAKILKSGMPVLRQAVLQGQYEFPKGLYFGGSKAEPQIESIRGLLKDIGAPYSKIVHIDLHTGYGERGKMHLFPNPPKSEEIRKATEALFAGYAIDWGDSKDFYTISGDFTGMTQALHPGKLVVPMTLEYGTMDSQTTMGSLRSIQTMILENQGFQHGYRNDRSQRKIGSWIREMYYPSSAIWQTMVMEQTAGLLSQVTERLSKTSGDPAPVPGLPFLPFELPD